MVPEAAVPGASARRVFVVYAHENPQHRDLVQRFTEFLRSEGIDAHFDRYAEGQRQQWDVWAEQSILEAEFVIVICSPSCIAALRSGSPPNVNRGIRHELTLIKELQAQDYLTWQSKILPVVLPPWTVDHIPLFLSPHNADRYTIDTLTPDAAKDLLDCIRGEPPYPLPPLGGL